MNEEIISFEYFEEMTANWKRVDLLRRCYDLCNEMVEKQQEIERLNNIINEIEKELDLNLPFKVIGVRGLKNKIKELKEK